MVNHGHQICQRWCILQFQLISLLHTFTKWWQAKCCVHIGFSISLVYCISFLFPYKHKSADWPISGQMIYRQHSSTMTCLESVISLPLFSPSFQKFKQRSADFSVTEINGWMDDHNITSLVLFTTSRYPVPTKPLVLYPERLPCCSDHVQIKNITTATEALDCCWLRQPCLVQSLDSTPCQRHTSWMQKCQDFRPTICHF